jgi:hypothetical protein
MARAVEQIERDIAALEEAVSAIAVELRSAYASYLKALGQAMRQQLILASYHLCTQGYPKAFLGLSFSQRQQLQQAIRKLGQQAAEQLLAYINTEESKAVEEGLIEIPVGIQAIQNNPFVQESEEILDVTTGITGSAITPTTTPQNSDSYVSSPEQLAQWQQNLEAAIAYTLKTLSLETNSLLQQAGILPQKLPAPLLEAAATASEASAEVMTGPPNLLNLLIEAENPEEPEDSTVTQIIAIHLRLAEIEFADVTVRAARNQIRNLEVRVSSLRREYQNKQRERIVAEAEAAWRTSWFDE